MSKLMKDEGYKYIKSLGYKQHLLLDENTHNYEVWVSSGETASYCLKYKNTALEFAFTPSAGELAEWLNW